MTGAARHFTLLARYNATFNRQLFGLLSPDAAGVGHDLLVQMNHIFVMDRLWLDRLQGCEDDARLAVAMDAMPFAARDDWWAARAPLDAAIADFVAAPPPLDADIAFVTRADNVRVRCRVDDALTHLFNHQSLHRGEIVHILQRRGVDFGNSDLLPLIVARADAEGVA